MANREQEIGQIKHLINKLRYVTLAVQIAPFAYTFLYIISLVRYLFCSEPILMVLNTLFYVSPVTVFILLVLSRILECCVWHKCACILPLLPQFLVFIDHFIIELTEAEAYISIITPIALSVLLLIAAYNVFIK